MHEYQFKLELQRDESDRPGPFSATPLARLQRDIWDALLRHSMRYVGDYQSVWGYLRRVTTRGEREGWFEATDDALTYSFPTFDGEARRSAIASYHWMRRALAANRNTIHNIAEQADARIEGEIDDLGPLLEQPSEIFIEYRDEPWLLRANGELELVSDEATLRWSELDDERRRLVEEAREQNRCGCRMCQQMRPDDEWEQTWREALNSPDIEQRREARWFILHSANPSTDAIMAAARDNELASLYRHLRSMNALGRRLPAERHEELSRAILETDDGTVQASLVACIAGMLLEPEQRVEVLRGMFDKPSPVVETAVEFLGYGELPDASRLSITEDLESRVGESDDLNYAIALTLYNIYRSEDYPPGVVKDTLQRLSRQPGEAADVAERALSWFEGRG